jgi:hypothetical protein
MRFRTITLPVLGTLIAFCAQSQSDSPQQSVADPSSPSLTSLSFTSGVAQLDRKLDKTTQHSLQRLHKIEARIKHKLARKDSTKAKELFGNATQTGNKLHQKLQQAATVDHYAPGLDTIASSIKFLRENPQLIGQVKGATEKLNGSLLRINSLQVNIQKAEEIKIFLRERRQYLREQLEKLSFAKQLKKLNKQAYYYSEQLKEYKSLLTDHKKAKRKAIELLSKTKLFQDFLRKNSQISSLLRLPGDPNNPGLQAASLAGLQTRVQLNTLIQQQIAPGGPGAPAQLQQNMQSAQGQLNDFKNKFSQLGASSGDELMPDGFKPNHQKTKSFSERLEYGFDFQSQKANNLFPVTSDIGLSVAYKLNDKSVIGIGGSYKMGLGHGWNYIRITHEGVSLRSFIDWRIKGSIWMTGGYEQNYRHSFKNFTQLQGLSGWQESGLLGLSKKYGINKRYNGKVQVLWDLLSYQQRLRTTPIIFRLGFSLK